MQWTMTFVATSVLLGIGLAMDAFSVSLVNGLNEPEMSGGRMCLIAGVYGGFQYLMPMVGWVCVHTIVESFRAFERFVPWIGLILLAYIGGKMIWESFHSGEEDREQVLKGGTLLLQGIATSIDALSVGFTIATYGMRAANACSLMIAAVTFVICYVGLRIGKSFGTKLSGKATLFGGVLLVAIGIKIFLGI